MTTQQQFQPDPSAPTGEDLGAEWGMKLGLALVEKIMLRKQAERLSVVNDEYAEHTRHLEAEVSQMAEMIEATEGLGKQNQRLTEENREFKKIIGRLGAEIADLTEAKEKADDYTGTEKASVFIEKAEAETSEVD